MKDPLAVSPSKGNQGTTQGKEKILLTEPTTSGLDLPLLCRLSYEAKSAVGRVTVHLIRRSWIRFQPIPTKLHAILPFRSFPVWGSFAVEDHLWSSSLNYDLRFKESNVEILSIRDTRGPRGLQSKETNLSRLEHFDFLSFFYL